MAPIQRTMSVVCKVSWSIRPLSWPRVSSPRSIFPTTGWSAMLRCGARSPSSISRMKRTPSVTAMGSPLPAPEPVLCHLPVAFVGELGAGDTGVTQLARVDHRLHGSVDRQLGRLSSGHEGALARDVQVVGLAG